jgi:predicted  nucleic acid-binding Zn-ribbon protein
LKEDLQHLISLQGIDASLASASIQKQEVPGKIARLDQNFDFLRERVDEEKRRLDELLKEHRAKEDSLKRGIEHLKKTKERLLEVKTNKEYQAMLKEIDSIVKKNEEIEDEIISKLEEIDAARNSLKVREAELAEFRLRYDKERKYLESEMSRIDNETAFMMKDIEIVREKIDSDILKQYDRIKAKRNGSAVAPVWKGVCEGCHMNLPPQMCNELQKSTEIVQCPFCSRIIYWDDRGENG